MNLPLAPRYVLPGGLLIVLLLALYSLPEGLRLLFTFEREAIGNGQWYRLLTGQFVHMSMNHVLANTLGIIILWLLYAEHAPGTCYLWPVIYCALGSNLGMYLFAPQIDYYVGFSGALYGIFAWGAAQDVVKGIRLGWLMLVGVVVKVTWEQFIGPVQIGMGVVQHIAVEAHFFGVLSGLLLFLGGWLKKW